MKVLIISPVPTHPTNSGNSSRILRLAEALIQEGHETHLAHIAFQPGDSESMRACWGERLHEIPYRKPWNKHRLGPLPIPDRWMHPLIRRGWAHMKLDHYWDVGMLDDLRTLHSRFSFGAVLSNYVFFSGSLHAFPASVLKVLDTHDVFADRHRLYRRAGFVPEWFYTTASEERQGLLRADRLLAIQGQDKNFFDHLLRGQRPVYEVGHLLPPAANKPAALPGLSLGFFGSSNLLNSESLHWFLREVWPGLQQEVPGVSLQIFGGVCDRMHQAKGIQLHGPISDPATGYSAASIFINPMRTGTGLKIKSLEAMAHGAVLVGSPVALAGLESAVGSGAFQVESAAEWCNTLKRLLAHPEVVGAEQALALKFADDYYQRQRSALTDVFQA